jgi:hypothetical protein
MPVHGGYVERFTAWGVPDSLFLRWFERRGADADEPRCKGQVPIGGTTKVCRACKRIPVLERKSEGGGLEEACHLVPIAAVTASVLTPRLWVRRDAEACANLGISNGWMFRNKKGEAERMGVYEPYMFELIQRAQDAGTVAERFGSKGWRRATVTVVNRRHGM